MTGSWVQICTAAARISEVTGKPVSVEDVHRLGGNNGPLTVVFLQQDHYVVLASSLASYLTDLACRGSDDQAETVPVGEGPELPLHIEDEYKRERNT